MPLTPGIDTYATVEELEAYASRRGITLTGDPEVQLIKAMDYLEIQNLRGTPESADQLLHFPTIEDGTPEAIKRAQIVAALLFDSGIDLMAPVGPAVKRQKVDVIEVEYAEGSGRTNYTQLTGLLKPFMGRSGAGVNFEVRRG